MLNEAGKSLKCQVEVNGQDNNGMTPLMTAIRNGNEKTADILCQCSDIDILKVKNKDGRHALDTAVYYGNISMFSKLILTLFERNKMQTMHALKAR